MMIEIRAVSKKRFSIKRYVFSISICVYNMEHQHQNAAMANTMKRRTANNPSKGYIYPLNPSFLKLDMIMDNVKYLEEQSSSFQGVKGIEEYKFLKETFTRNLLALESIETKGIITIVEFRYVDFYTQMNILKVNFSLRSPKIVSFLIGVLKKK